MTRLAIAGEQGFAVSLADAPKPSGAPNFTLETLESVCAELPPCGALFCLMGVDSFLSLRRWHGAAEIPFVAPLIVASRPGQGFGQRIAALRAALPAGLTIEAEPTAADSGASVELRSYLLHNPAGESAPFYLLPGLHVEIGASQIRDRIRGRSREQVRAALGGGTGGREWLPEAVSDYILSHGLYL